MYDNLSKVIEVDIDEVLPNRFQPRIQFDEKEILELSDSIKEHGVIQPLVVRTIGDKYEIIAGERRYKASVLAGKETVPVIVKNLNDKDSAEIALIENIQRKNLTPIEEALSYKKILDMGYITQENLASKLGKSQPSVANKIRLLNLSDEVQEALLENKISERHARSLLKLSTSKEQNEMLNRIISERLTVRRTDEEIEKMKNNTSDEDNDNTQKIIEKGEIDMNNNTFGIPNIPQQPQSTPEFDIFSTSNSQPVIGQQNINTTQNVVPPTPETQSQNFDIFGGNVPIQNSSNTNSTTINSVPSVQPTMPEMPVMGGIQFDANGNVVSQNTQSEPPVVPIIDSVPSVQPTMPEMPVMGGIQFDANGNVVSQNPQPEPPVVPIIDSMPSVQPTMPEMPVMGGIQFDANGNVVSQNPQPEPSVVPTMPVIDSIVPQTAPIIESPTNDSTSQMTQQSQNLFGFGDSVQTSASEPIVQPEIPSIPEFKMPEPIIVTDYSKQYDPIMPPSPENIVPTVDFKEVINAIRECSNKIEQYGFKIDVEEYDLANLYQVIFKIEK